MAGSDVQINTWGRVRAGPGSSSLLLCYSLESLVTYLIALTKYLTKVAKRKGAPRLCAYTSREQSAVQDGGGVGDGEELEAAGHIVSKQHQTQQPILVFSFLSPVFSFLSLLFWSRTTVHAMVPLTFNIPVSFYCQLDTVWSSEKEVH